MLAEFWEETAGAFKNSSVDCAIGSVRLTAVTIWRAGLFLDLYDKEALWTRGLGSNPG